MPIAVRFQDEMLWLTLNGVAELFDVDKSVASQHLGCGRSSAIWNTTTLTRLGNVR